jgi:hypothetical protein
MEYGYPISMSIFPAVWVYISPSCMNTPKEFSTVRFILVQTRKQRKHWLTYTPERRNEMPKDKPRRVPLGWVATKYGMAKLDVKLPDSTEGMLCGITLKDTDIDWDAFLKDYPQYRTNTSPFFHLLVSPDVILERSDE